MSQIDWITDKSLDKYAKKAVHEELNAFYGVAKFMRDSGMEHSVIAENLKTIYGATPEQVEMVQKEVLGKTADRINDRGEFDTKEDYEEFTKIKNDVISGIDRMVTFIGKERVAIIIENILNKVVDKTADVEKSAIKTAHWEIVVEDTINNDREVGRDYVETNNYEQAYNYAFSKFGTKNSSRYRVTINSYNTLF